MNLKRIDNYVTVWLSRRNLLSLLHKLDMPESHRTLVRKVEDGNVLIVIGEDDNIHYGDRTPGPMIPETEKFISGEAQFRAGYQAGVLYENGRGYPEDESWHRFKKR